MGTNKDVFVSIIDVESVFIKSLAISSTNILRINRKVIIDQLQARVYMNNITQNEYTEMIKLIVVR